MAISVSSRIRNALVGLTATLCLLFAALIFLLVYVIEDQVFTNQIEIEKQNYEQAATVSDWQPLNSNIKFHRNAGNLPATIPEELKGRLLQQEGIYEFFDDNNAMFIAQFKRQNSDPPYFLVYDVSELLAVRGSKSTLFGVVGALTILIAILAIFLSRWLTRSILAPVKKLSDELRNSDIDDVVIELANEFTEDEVGILAHELALALGRVQKTAQREFEFNRGVSHELRSPIQVAQSSAELLEATTDSSLHKPVQRLRRAVTEMNEIVEAFLWLASERSVQRNDGCPVSELVKLASDMNENRPQIDIRINSDFSSSFDYPMPRQVLAVVVRSLINNAIKFSVEGRIQVHFSAQELSVSNRVDPDNKDSSGFGIGLVIVQRICDRFNCTLLAKQDDPSVFLAEVNFKKD